MTAGKQLDALLDVMATLRGPDGCAWDREQTMSSLRPFVLEEAHELVDAIRSGESDAIREELGDLLLEVVFVTQIATEAGLFDMAAVTSGIREKLLRRHPHVFGDARASTPGKAIEHWEAIKAKEKPRTSSVLDNVPVSMPALARAEKLSKRAASVGFDWESRQQVLDKIAEELAELDEATAQKRPDAVHEEMGDLLFAVVNLARHSGVDAEISLSDASEKFSKRFRYIEERVAASGRELGAVPLEELEALWQNAKQS